LSGTDNGLTIKTRDAFIKGLVMKIIKIYILFFIISSFIIIFSSCNILDGNQQNNPSPKTGLYSINIDGTNQKELVSDGVGTFSFTDNYIIYGYFSLMNMNGSNQHTILPNSLLPATFSVSPNGMKIVCSTSTHNLYIANNDGSDIKEINVPDTISGKSNPHLSYDNNHIVFLGTNGIYQIGINSDNCKKLKDTSKLLGTKLIDPCFSPDNKNIIYAEYNNSTNLYISLHILNLSSLADTVLFNFSSSSENYYEISSNNNILFTTGGNIHEVNINTFVDNILTQGLFPHYSPDFSYITFTDLDNTIFELMNLSTKKIIKIQTSLKKGLLNESKLSPDGTKLIFSGVTYSF
jgi:hypothetical protein